MGRAERRQRPPRDYRHPSNRNRCHALPTPPPARASSCTTTPWPPTPWVHCQSIPAKVQFPAGLPPLPLRSSTLLPDPRQEAEGTPGTLVLGGQGPRGSYLHLGSSKWNWWPFPRSMGHRLQLQVVPLCQGCPARKEASSQPPPQGPLSTPAPQGHGPAEHLRLPGRGQQACALLEARETEAGRRRPGPTEASSVPIPPPPTHPQDRETHTEHQHRPNGPRQGKAWASLPVPCPPSLPPPPLTRKAASQSLAIHSAVSCGSAAKR